MHKFSFFQVVYLNESFEYWLSMPIINTIDGKCKGSTDVYLFAPSMFNESSTTGNKSVFGDLNIIQMAIEKTDNQWVDCLIFW